MKLEVILYAYNKVRTLNSVMQGTWLVQVMIDGRLTPYPCSDYYTNTFEMIKALSCLLTCGTKSYELDTQWELNSLLKVC